MNLFRQENNDDPNIFPGTNLSQSLHEDPVVSFAGQQGEEEIFNKKSFLMIKRFMNKVEFPSLRPPPPTKDIRPNQIFNSPQGEFRGTYNTGPSRMGQMYSQHQQQPHQPGSPAPMNENYDNVLSCHQPYHNENVFESSNKLSDVIIPLDTSIRAVINGRSQQYCECNLSLSTIDESANMYEISLNKVRELYNNEQPKDEKVVSEATYVPDNGVCGPYPICEIQVFTDNFGDYIKVTSKKIEFKPWYYKCGEDSNNIYYRCPYSSGVT